MKKLLTLPPILTVFLVVGIASSASLDAFEKVVVIVGDDHAYQTSEVYPNSGVSITPNLDRLAAQGTKLNSAFCNSPICSASRQSLLTGKYPYATGVNLLFTPFPDEGNITVAEHLRDRGFATALVGKHHFNNWVWSPLYQDGLPNHGFELIVGSSEYERKWEGLTRPEVEASIETYQPADNENDVAELMNWRVLPKGVLDKDSKTNFYVEEALDFMDTNRDGPFLLWLAFHEPHYPFHFPVEFAGRIDPGKVLLPETSEEDAKWLPKRYQSLTVEQRRGIIAAYCTSTAYLDYSVGKVLDGIESLGIGEETLVVYLSDNGYLLNNHKRFEKHTFWEEAVRVPTVFRGRGIKQQEVDELVEYVDVVPTLLDLMGQAPLGEAQGSSFRSLLEGGKGGKQYVFSTYLEDNGAMVRTKRWKYIFTTGNRELGIGYSTGKGPLGIEHRLYDLLNDPQETRNLYRKENHKDKAVELKHLMLEHFERTHPDAKNCPTELTLVGKLVWYCEPRDIGTDQSLRDIPTRVFMSP